MHALTGTRQGRALYLLAWLLFGAALAWLLTAATGAELAASLLFAAPLCALFGVAAGYSVYYLCRANPLHRGRRWNLLALFGAAALTTAALWTVTALGWRSLWLQVLPDLPAVPWGRSMAATICGLGVILYGLCAAATYLAMAVERARELEHRALQGELAAREAELRMLRTQVDPHFLFNSLNSISALTAIDPAAARDMTVQLADFFRSTLGFDANGRISLRAELELAGRFIAIEQVRFGPRLAWCVDVDADAADCLLPPLVLQPLVENAVKHGIGQLIEGGTVTVRARRSGAQLRVRVENDHDPEGGAPRRGAGVGIANVRERLAAAYGVEAGLQCAAEGARFWAELTLPAHTGE